MHRMRPSVRLAWCAVMIVGSALYGILVASDPRIASAVALGYVAVLLTIFVANEIWKKS